MALCHAGMYDPAGFPAFKGPQTGRGELVRGWVDRFPKSQSVRADVDCGSLTGGAQCHPGSAATLNLSVHSFTVGQSRRRWGFKNKIFKKHFAFLRWRHAQDFHLI